MANAMFGDNLHAVLDRVIGSNGDDRAGHNFVNECVAGGSSLQNHLAGVVPLGDDPHKLAIGHDQKSAHGFFGHHGDSLIDGGGGLHRPDGITFLLQNRSDCFRHRLPPRFSLKTVPKQHLHCWGQNRAGRFRAYTFSTAMWDDPGSTVFRLNRLAGSCPETAFWEMAPPCTCRESPCDQENTRCWKMTVARGSEMKAQIEPLVETDCR